MGLALLVSCVRMGMVNEQPPYKFLVHEKLRNMEARIGSGSCLMTYMSNRTPDSIHSEAMREIAGGAWITEKGAMVHVEPDSTDRDVFIMGVGSTMAAGGPSVPKGTRTIIWVYRDATILDRIRGWFYGWKRDEPMR